jgi:hypothetical protein
VDYIVTPEEIVFTEHDRRKPEGIYWELLEEEKLKTSPILRKLGGEPWVPSLQVVRLC